MQRANPLTAARRQSRARGMKWARARLYTILNEFGAQFLAGCRQVQNVLQMGGQTCIDFIEGALACLNRKIRGYTFTADFSCPLYTVTATRRG